MKILTSLLLIIAPLFATAASHYQGMNKADIEKSMQQMRELQACMKNIDQSELKKIEMRSRKVDTEIKSLCAQGKRDAAQNKAISYGKEISKNPTMKKMTECAAKIKQSPAMKRFIPQDKDYSKLNVCD
ncbi:MAG: hypothetical protein BMS9Abin26_0194 [Gammaproteobacteria bacterium]|nr:MAG: hypothetical protein BMS9Abin26_0194 [Gammaproteobacteria bacterium]